MPDCLLVGPGTVGGMPFVGVFRKGPNLYLREFREKTTESYERLGREARSGTELRTSCLPVLSA